MTENYVHRKVIGEGQYGKVYKVQDKYDNVWAEKIIELFDMDGIINPQNIRETNILSVCKNYNGIIKCNSIKYNNSSKSIILCMPLGYTLDTYIKITSSKDRILNFIDIFKDVVFSLHKLHSINLIHGDIKAGNVVLIAGVATLIDFGGTVFEQTKYTRHTSTVTYRSPELFESTNNIDTSNDIWSLGILFLEYIIGYNPVQKYYDFSACDDENEKNIYNFIKTDKLSEVISSIDNKFCDLLTKMLTVDKKKRCCINDVVKFFETNGDTNGDTKDTVIVSPFSNTPLKYNSFDFAVIKEFHDIVKNCKIERYKYCFPLAVSIYKRYINISGDIPSINILSTCMFISISVLTNNFYEYTLGQIDNELVCKIVTVLDFKLYTETFYKWMNTSENCKIGYISVFGVYSDPCNFNLSYQDIKNKYYKDGRDIACKFYNTLKKYTEKQEDELESKVSRLIHVAEYIKTTNSLGYIDVYYNDFGVDIRKRIKHDVERTYNETEKEEYYKLLYPEEYSDVKTPVYDKSNEYLSHMNILKYYLMMCQSTPSLFYKTKYIYLVCKYFIDNNLHTNNKYSKIKLVISELILSFSLCDDDSPYNPNIWIDDVLEKLIF